MRGRPKGGKNRKYELEFMIEIINRYLDDKVSLPRWESELNISHSVSANWIRHYQEDGIEGLKSIHKGKGNPYAALSTSKSLTEVQRLKLELMKRDIEIERLKKGYTVKGVGSQKEYVTLSNKSIK